MSDESKAGGGNSMSGIIGFVVIVAALTGFNHWRQGSSLKDQCGDQNLGAAFCDCFKGEMMSEIGIQSSLPLVGRFFKSDEKWQSAQVSSNATCIVETAGQ